MILKSSLRVRGEILSVVHEDLHGALVLLEDLEMHMGNNGETLRGMIGKAGLSDLNPSGVFLLDFCASHALSIANTVVKHKSALKCMWKATRSP